MLIAASLALSTFKIFKLPNGGSISLGCMPLILLSARHGIWVGIFCGILQGFLMTIISPSIIHPVQFLLDYPLAYACIGLSGVVVWFDEKQNSIILSLKAVAATTAAYFFRMLMHVIAAIVFFSDGKAFNEALVIGFSYNLGHILPETILCAIFVFLLTYKRNQLCARQ